MVPDGKGRLARRLDSLLRSSVVLLASFVFLEVGIEVLAGDGFVADDAVDGIDGSLHIARERAVRNGVIG